MRTQHISKNQMSNPADTPSYQLSLPFPLLTVTSFQHFPPRYCSSPCSSSAQPGAREAASTPALTQLSGGQGNCSSSTPSGSDYPKTKQSSLTRAIKNTLDHTNCMGPLPKGKLEGNSTKALMLIPIISSNARKITISSGIKQLVYLT